MSERRRFNRTERAVLYIAADGRCSNCGAALQSGWHSDHITPHSAGGGTDVVNGQALCPPCNVQKGNVMIAEPRAWQTRAAAAFAAHAYRDFLVCATPGAGKTRFALDLAVEQRRIGAVQRVVVVVPTDPLRQQWVDAAAARGLDLMPVAQPEDYDKDGYHGCVVTYAQLAVGVGAELVRRSTRTPTIAILDEIHHAGDNESWGVALSHAVEHATYRLALTGTPWRRNPSSPIPFVGYGPDGRVIVNSSYEYGEAVADGVCRRVEFHAYDGEARWADCGRIIEAGLGADLSDRDMSAALDAVLAPSHRWIPSLLDQANRALTELREEVPDAGGLVVAHEQWLAKEYARLLRNITGEEPTLAISEDDDAKDNIDSFSRNHNRWLVAVKMVSEGVDIPRLLVGVYAAKAKTPLFFRQVVGRFVRTRPGEEVNARLFIPAVPAFMAHARAIEEELRHQLDLEAERDDKTRAEARAGQQLFELRQPLSASEPVFSQAIYGGEGTAADRYSQAEAQCRKLGLPERYAINLVPVLDQLLADQMAPAYEVTVTPAPPREPRARREKLLRAEIKTLVGKVAYRAGHDPQEVNTQLLRSGFPARAKASIDDLERTLRYLAEWLAEL